CAIWFQNSKFSVPFQYLVNFIGIIISIMDSTFKFSLPENHFDNDFVFQTVDADQSKSASKFRMQPPLFTGEKEQDITEWLVYYERACRVNLWNTDAEKARFLPCFLAGAAAIWFNNLENSATLAQIESYIYLTAQLKIAFNAKRVSDALEFKLRNRTQEQNEDVSSYYHSVVYLCRRTNATMSDEAIVRHLLYGLKPELIKDVMLMDNATPKDFYENAIKAEHAQKFSGNVKPTLNDISKQLAAMAASIQELMHPKLNLLPTFQSDPSRESFSQAALPAPLVSDFNSSQDERFCTYCRRNNHFIENCWALQRKNQNYDDYSCEEDPSSCEQPDGDEPPPPGVPDYDRESARGESEPHTREWHQ
ncbi:MAG: hypothetical protein ACRDCT_29380, partial [Shewanella sp.]